MSGYLDAATQGVCVKEPVLKTSSRGNPYAQFMMVCGENDAKQFISITCFGDVASHVAETLHKGAKCYCEGSLTAETYQREGETKVSLRIAARRVDIQGQIGKARPKQSVDRSAGYDRQRDSGRSSGYRHPQHERPFDDYEAMR